MSKQVIRSSSGFSLVELMVVIGIIGILSAVAIPKLQMFSAKAKRAEAQSMLKFIHTINESFYAENSRYQARDEITPQVPQGKNYEMKRYFPVNPEDDWGYWAGAELIDGKSLCPGVTSDRWVIGECQGSFCSLALFPWFGGPNSEAAALFQREGGTTKLSGGPYPKSQSLNCQ